MNPQWYAVLQLLLLTLAAAGFGTLVFPDSRKKENSIDFSVAVLGLGFIIIALLTLLAAALHCLGLSFYLVVTTTGIVFLFFRRSCFTGRGSSSRPGAKSLLVLLPFALLALFYSLFPPSFYDALLYHLAVPAYYLRQGGLAAWENNFFASLPLNVEMLYLFFLQGGGALAAKLFSLLCALLTGALLYTWLDEKNKGKWSLLPALLFFSTPEALFLAATEKNDLAALLFILLGTRFYFLHLRAGGRARLLLSGLFWGAAIGSKYVAAYPLAAVLISGIFLSGRPGRKKFSAGLLICLLVLVMLSPWMLKNFVYNGNPLYPYLNDLWPNENWSDQQAAYLKKMINPNQGSLSARILFPWHLFTRPYSFGVSSVTGLVFLLVLPLAFSRKLPPEFRQLRNSALLTFLLILPFASISRYYLPVFMLLSLPLAAGLAGSNPGAPARRVFIPVLALCLPLQLFQSAELLERFTRGGTFLSRVIRGELPAGTRYLDLVPYYRAAGFINRNTPTDAGILVLGEERSFYLERRFCAASQYDRHPFLETLKKDSSAALDFIAERKLSYILVTRDLENYKSSAGESMVEADRLKKFLAKLTVCYQDRNYLVYKTD